MFDNGDKSIVFKFEHWLRKRLLIAFTFDNDDKSIVFKLLQLLRKLSPIDVMFDNGDKFIVSKLLPYTILKLLSQNGNAKEFKAIQEKYEDAGLLRK